MIIADEPTPIELTLPACSICGLTEGIVRFALVRPVLATPSRRKSTRGAGCINLCERCWRAATRDTDMHLRRRPRRRIAA